MSVHFGAPIHTLGRQWPLGQNSIATEKIETRVREGEDELSNRNVNQLIDKIKEHDRGTNWKNRYKPDAPPLERTWHVRSTRERPWGKEYTITHKADVTSSGRTIVEVRSEHQAEPIIRWWSMWWSAWFAPSYLRDLREWLTRRGIIFKESKNF